MTETFKISAHINKDIWTVWHTYHQPNHIKNWNHASADWHTTHAESDFRETGRFLYRMEAKDGSFGFDFSGVFLVIDAPNHITYRLDDQRVVTLDFKSQDDTTLFEGIIEAEKENVVSIQKRGWQAIVNNFKNYVESLLD